MTMSAPLYFIMMVCLTIILNLALSGYNVVILKRIIDHIRPPLLDIERQNHPLLAKKRLRAYRRTALIFGTALAAFLRIGLTLILSDILVFSFTKIIAALLLLWTSWVLFRSLTSPTPDDDSSHSASLIEAIPKIIIADLALGLDNILAVACVSIHHHAILISGLAISIIAITLGVMMAPARLLQLRWLEWVGLVIMIGLSIHLLIHGVRDVSFPLF
ncbi:TerC family protein [Bombella saccharophila]|uniref:TerC family protein n=1 Tax=Bombella saccharophila TaxID=2967338 RepID=A0ABT3WAP3_9PROT|nr:TerC family protein [Bombella saccharophila]MCX5614051.1 TerC family protein [Bombella saccharophila]